MWRLRLLQEVKVALMYLPGSVLTERAEQSGKRKEGRHWGTVTSTEEKNTEQEMNLLCGSWLECTSALKAVITLCPTRVGSKRAVRSAFSWPAQWGQVLFMPWLVHFMHPTLSGSLFGLSLSCMSACMSASRFVCRRSLKIESEEKLASSPSPILQAFSFLISLLLFRPSLCILPGQPETSCTEGLLLALGNL